MSFHKLLNPVSNEHVRVTLLRRVAVRGEHKLLPVRRKHREAVKRVVESDPLQSGAINVDLVKIEVSPARVINIRREDDALAVGKKVRTKVRFAVTRYLAL